MEYEEIAKILCEVYHQGQVTWDAIGKEERNRWLEAVEALHLETLTRAEG